MGNDSLREADRAADRRYNLLEITRTEIENLTVERTRRNGELVSAQNKLAQARAQLSQTSARGPEDQIDKWTREVQAWEQRVQDTTVEFEAAGARLLAAKERLQAITSGDGESQVIVAGDALEVLVLQDETLKGIYPVRRGGYIVLPRVGRIMVAGLDLVGAELAVKQALQATQIREATVVIERAQGAPLGTARVILLAGEFARPGPWTIPPGTAPTLVTTLLQSGGVTEAGDLSCVRLLRVVAGRQLAEEFNVEAMLSGRELTADVPINAGDIIVVPTASNVVYVSGSVGRPGPLKLPSRTELTAYSAILSSGGFSRFANHKKIYILRENGPHAKQRIPVNVSEIQRGAAPDITLRKNDIIIVPERFFSF